MKHKLPKLFFRDWPAFRLASLFLWWGAFHFSWMVFLLWTNYGQVRCRFFALLGLQLAFGILLLVAHLKGISFRPLRTLRILLWLLSIAMLLAWALFPMMETLGDYPTIELEQPAEIGTSQFIVFMRGVALDALKALHELPDYMEEYGYILGRAWLFCAFLAQLAADVVHTICEWRASEEGSRDRLRRSIAVGLSFAALPLASVLCPVLLGHYLWKACESYVNEQRILRSSPEAEDKAIHDDLETFEKTEKEMTAAWKSGAHSETFAKWEALKDGTTGKWLIEKKRLGLLPYMLRDGIPDDASLCQRIQAALLEAETAIKPLEREGILWNNDYERQLMLKSGAFGEDEFCVSPIIRAHFKHYREPLSSMPVGLERCWNCLILKRIDEFYQLELKSLDTPLEEMAALEAQFARRLHSIPWNYALFAPHTK